ncbi:MAG: hypothetical protein K6E50_01695 [Lachnospiraceae bacterium]|nr:hypothetical protein [Lachnospiraceae bacterium]
MKKNRIGRLVPVLALSVLLTACNENNEPRGTYEPEITEVPAAPTAEPTEAPTPTEIPKPTATPTPVQDQKISVAEIDHYVMSPVREAYFPEDEASRQAYCDLIDGIMAHKSVVRLTDDWDHNLIIWGAVSESPYYFIVDKDRLSDDHKSLELTYRYDAEESAEMLHFIDESYVEILNECITENMSDLEKVLSIYHYFGERISYDYEWYENAQATEADERFKVPDIAVYDALKSNEGVCHSYTYLCQFAFQQLGIECLRVTADMAEGDESHMWPIVKIDGMFYNIDPTWDSHDGNDTVGLQYFGMTYEEATADRGILGYDISIDMAYGDVICEDERFASLHDVYDYHMNYDGTITVVRTDGSEEIVNVREWEE